MINKSIEYLNDTMKSSGRIFKNAIYEQFSRIGKAVSSPKRLELLDLLCQGERTVEVLANEASLSLANASQHLQLLRAARLVESEKRGQFVIYRITDEAVCEFFLSMRVLAERELAEVEQLKRRFPFGWRLVNRLKLDRPATLMHVIIELERMPLLFLELDTQPVGKAAQALLLKVSRHGQVQVSRVEFLLDLLVNCVFNYLADHVCCSFLIRLVFGSIGFR